MALFSAQPSHAANAGDFQAGRIIDDAVFTNKSAMSVSDIQNFLNSKVPVCDTNHPAGPSAQGAQPPWICLKDYTEGGKSAARIIYDAAQTYSINPKVLLVTLQKENGLITDTWPYPWQYRTAMGFGCPDGAPCDAQWYGFTNQVNQGARHFRGFFDNSLSFVPYRPGNNFIQYNPNSGCGGTTINIQNKATAALYSYTPYQPNAAALNNLYGSGDGCSAYGNRNFLRDFTDWFGSPLAEENTVDRTWNFEALDGDAVSISQADGATGQSPKAIEFNGSLHVFYYDVTNGNLRHSYEGGAGWQFETLDGANTSGGRISADVGKMPTAINYSNSLHVFYYDVTNGNLRHAWSDSQGTNWQFETLDGAGGASFRGNANLGVNPAATIYNGTIQLYYYDVTNGNLRHAWYSALKGWQFENLDGDPGSVGKSNANLGEDPVVTVYNNHLQLYYYDVTNGNLRHAWTSSKGWNFENLDGDPGSVFKHNTRNGLTPEVIAIGSKLYVFYYDQEEGILRAAYADESGWHTANLDGNAYSVSGRVGNSGIDPTATLYGNSLQLFYYDSSLNNLRHAWGI